MSKLIMLTLASDSTHNLVNTAQIVNAFRTNDNRTYIQLTPAYINTDGSADFYLYVKETLQEIQDMANS